MKRYSSVINNENNNYRNNRTKTLQTQKKLQLIYHDALRQGNIISYKKLKFHGLIFTIGEFVQLYQINSAIPYIAKIRNIVSVKKSQKQLNQSKKKNDDQITSVPFLQIEWYMRKKDISDQKLKKYINSFSMNQLFGSSQLFYIPIESIIGKCQVLSFDQYSLLGIIEDSIYFTRANYNQKLKIMTPDPSQWKKQCQCNMPYNPDLQYIECQQCQKWFHCQCNYKKCNNQDGNKIQFICINCQNKHSKKKGKK